MELSLTTPALLFPAISLLMVAYSNRFLAIGSRIRSLHAQYRNQPDVNIASQIKHLRQRVSLIRNMQALGVGSLFTCVVTMFALFAGNPLLGKYLFGLSLVMMMGSLALSLREILISVRALNLELSDMAGEE
ncbi:MAG: DUF2721 domain-containing protein [Thermodesulfobacteriota bacterium]